MRKNIKKLLAQKGYSPIFASIDKSINDLKSLRYEREEIRETLEYIYGKEDTKIVTYINDKLC